MADNLSKIVSCGHCGNISHMKIIGTINNLQIESDTEIGPFGEWGTIFIVLECPACKKNIVVSYGWHDGMESEDEITYEILFPKDKNIPIGLPANILKAFIAAEKIKTIDVNAYVILLRRLLELVCKDRNAVGSTLALMLKDLANRNEIPDKLVNVAKGLKDFGNIGAHAGIGELSEKEIPIVGTLCSAILEYIYSAPYLSALAENKLNAIKQKKK